MIGETNMKFKMMVDKFKNFLSKHLLGCIVSLIVLFVLIIIVFMMSRVNKELNTISIENAELYQFLGTQRFDFSTKLTIDNSKGITELKLDNEEASIELDSTPFFYVGEKKALFPKEMSVVFPLSNGTQKKLSHFSFADENGLDIYLKNNTLNYPVNQAFLFDGNDLYFFLNDMTLTFDNEALTIPRFSYAILNFNNELIVFNYDLQEATLYQNFNSDVFASNENYKINLSIDAIIYGEKSRLLIKKFDYLEKLN